MRVANSYIRLWRVILLLRNSYIATKVAVILKRYVRDVHTFLVKDDYLYLHPFRHHVTPSPQGDGKNTDRDFSTSLEMTLDIFNRGDSSTTLRVT